MRARSTFSSPFFTRQLAVWGTLLALLLAIAPSALGQAAYQPEFDVEVVNTRSGETTTLDVYTSIPYRNLRFLAAEEGFEAGYAVTAEVHRLDEAGEAKGLLLSRSWERSVAVPTYDETQASDSTDRSLQSMDVPAGRYLVEIVVEDESSRRTFAREITTTVRDLREGVALSDPLFLEEYNPDASRIVPNVGAALSTEDESALLYYEIYTETAADLQVTYVVTEQNRVRERPSFRALLGLAPQQRDELGTPVIVSEPLSVEAGRTPATFRLDTEALQVGEYVLTVRLDDATGTPVAESERAFAVRWMGLDAQIANLDEAIRQLRYVAKNDELDALRQAEDPRERMRLFRAFWDSRDPTPGTARNERMEQYYYRVSYANERYGRFQNSGWNTDRGEVFIRFGQPDFVENHPFNYGTDPYQIWFYESRGRRFIFVDETGTGDYRLAVPIWDDRTRY